MSARGGLFQVLTLLRPHNCLIAAASVAVGSFLASSTLTPAAALGAAAAFLIAAGGYVLNDLYDIWTDRIGKPWRPLAAGSVSRRVALILFMSTWVAGTGLCAAAGPIALSFGLSWQLLLWLYSWRLKSAGPFGHVLVSAVASSGFLMGAALGGDTAAGAVPFGVGLAFHLAREVVKGTADIRGDAAAGIRTLPAVLGERRSAVLCVVSIVAVMVLSIVPYAAGVYGLYYLLPVLAMQPLFALCIYLVAASLPDGAARARAHERVATLLKAAMPVGLLAFVLGGL